MITNFQIKDKIGKPRFFQKTFLIVDTKFEMILRMSFLKISNINMLFGKRTFT